MARRVAHLVVWLAFSAGSSACPLPETPPDLTHISGTGCRLRQYAVDTLNIQTKQTDDLHYVEVTAYAKYDDARDEWTLSLGTFKAPDADTIPRETTDRCSIWLKKTREAIVHEHREMGHRLKGVKK